MPGDESVFAAHVEKHLEAPMPWIGMYIAMAALFCTLAMTADTFNGFQRKKLWFPSKFFSMNATSLTLLAVAMKLPVDLTTRMYTPTDRLAKVSSLIFMSTAMGNFMTCLGSMDDKDILMNVTALGILVITVISNVCIQIIQMRDFLKARFLFAEEIIAAICMLLLLVMVVSAAIMVPTTKRYLESKYQELLKRTSDEQLLESMEEGGLTYDKLKLMILKYWLMAETSDPQFVIARSVACTASGIMCLLAAFILVQAEVRMVIEHKRIHQTPSLYGWSVKWTVLFQSIGVAVGTVAPAFRWFTLHIRDRKWRKVLHYAKGLILKIVVRVQILIVLSSKVVLFISVCFASPIISCFHCIKMLKNLYVADPSRIHGISESKSMFHTEPDLGRYVLLLEGEVELPSLHSQEPPGCWSLSVVTLTSIAVALPHVSKYNINQLIQGVDEGLFYVKLIEKSRKWQDKDLHETSLKGRSSKETLQELSDESEKFIMEFKKDVKDFLMENPLNWPVKVIAANSMYRVSQRLLKAYEGDHLHTDDRLFEQLSVMIANILAACLTNLMSVIIMKCHHKAINEKAKNVRQAALLLGEMEEILQFLQQHLYECFALLKSHI